MFSIHTHMSYLLSPHAHSTIPHTCSIQPHTHTHTNTNISFLHIQKQAYIVKGLFGIWRVHD